MARDQTSATSAALNSLDGKAFVTLHSRLDRGGALQARRLANGVVQFYWRYTLRGKTSREPIGVYDPTAPPKKLEPTSRGYGVAAALEKCRELAGVHVERADTGGLREVKAERRKAFSAKKAADEDKALRTLRKMLETYTQHLKMQHRTSHVDALQIFHRHVFEAWPRVADAPAVDLTPDQVLDMLRRLIEAGKGRTANKLRSYLRAAYQCALDVRTTASIPMAFKAFGVTFNPAAQTRRSPQYDRADKRPFSIEELRVYWQLIRDRRGLEAATLRIHLLTGAQRIEQFVRLRCADVAHDAITIFDAKGRPGQGPRPHQIPLIREAQLSVRQLSRDGAFAITTTSGKKPISVRTMAAWAHAVVGASIEGFQLKRLRSGVETLLAANGISREVRGQLQSHGLTGVQARHYDGHDYMREKRAALDLLLKVLEYSDRRRQPITTERHAAHRMPNVVACVPAAGRGAPWWLDDGARSDDSTSLPLPTLTMGYSYRRYFVAQDDLIYRMATAAFDRMLREPARFAVPEFADQRIRSAELVVELIGGDAVAVVRTSFSVLAFDAAGRLDMSRLRTQQMARLESALSPVLGSRSRDDKIVEADMRFIAQGGTWAPPKALATAIEDAALGLRKCPRLQVHDRGRQAQSQRQ